MQIQLRKTTITIFDTILIVVACTSFAAIFLLICGVFKAITAICVGMFLSISIHILFRLRTAIRDKRFGWGVIAILIIALVFRVPPYTYVAGGQDQGVYTNMSAVFERDGYIFITDKVRGGLNEEEKKLYDKNNQLAEQYIHSVDGKTAKSHLPGVYLGTQQDERYTFQFYHLHPLWMSIFGFLLGSDNHGYAMVFFALISIIAFYLLAYEITNGKKIAAYLVAVLLAISPLHAFFSKFSASEMTALAFMSSSLYCLVKYHRLSSDGSPRLEYLLLSATLAGCFFLTRITGFAYLPFFILTIFSIITTTKNKLIAKHNLIYLTVILVLYGASVMYGLTFSRPYTLDIFGNFFVRLSVNHWIGLISVALAIILVAAILIASLPSDGIIKKILRRILRISQKILPPILGVVLILAMVKIFQWGFTEQYFNSNSDLRWDIAGYGLGSLKYTGIIVFVTHITPIGAILFVMAINHVRKIRNDYLLGLLAFITIFAVANFIFQFVVPYQYYYARYLFGELIPFSLLLVAIYMGYLWDYSTFHRKMAIVTLLVIVTNLSYFTIHQLQGKEADGASVAMNTIKEQLQENDLLLIYKENFPFFIDIKTALDYYHGVNTFAFQGVGDLRKLGRIISHEYNRVYILTGQKLDVDFVNTIDNIPYKSGHFISMSNSVPLEYLYDRANMWLYEINKTQYTKWLSGKSPINRN